MLATPSQLQSALINPSKFAPYFDPQSTRSIQSAVLCSTRRTVLKAPAPRKLMDFRSERVTLDRTLPVDDLWKPPNLAHRNMTIWPVEKGFPILWVIIIPSKPGSIIPYSNQLGVSDNVVYPEKPNGFADHYPYEKWLFHWED